MKEKNWKRLHCLAGVLVILLCISFYQQEKQKGLQQDVQSLFVKETMVSTGVSKEEKRKVYLTFDDGPSRYTEEILAILEEEGVKATFFVIGHEGEVYAKRYREIVEQGHTLAMHAYNHDYNKIYRSIDAFSNDLNKIQNLLEETTGVKATIYRFPGGSSNSNMKVPVKKLIQYLNTKGITYYDWNALSEDAIYKNMSAGQLNKNVLKDLKNHNPCIVLMHDLGDRHGTVEALKPLIHRLKEMNCELLPITETTPAIQHVKIKE